MGDFLFTIILFHLTLFFIQLQSQSSSNEDYVEFPLIPSVNASQTIRSVIVCD